MNLSATLHRVAAFVGTFDACDVSVLNVFSNRGINSEQTGRLL